MVPHAAHFSVGFEINRMPDRRHCREYGCSHDKEGEKVEERTSCRGYIGT
jgi:hypothetical protein